MPGKPYRISFFKNTLFWSVVAAAFIGPGTVTTAGKAGAEYGAALLWAIVLSIGATMILQEAAARLTIATGRTLGEHFSIVFSHAKAIPWLIVSSVVFGCAAYEAGNLVGAVAGLQIIFPQHQGVYAVLIFVFALMILRRNNLAVISRMLGILVAFMGGAFILVASQTRIALSEVVRGLTHPLATPQAILLMIGLVGTTIVPYNLFLGSRLGKGQTVREMRRGLIPAVILGGVITISILLTGTRMDGAFQFDKLAIVLTQQLGPWAKYLFGVGLLAAGLTSAITAPLAAAITVQSLRPGWTEHTRQYRAVWFGVLTIGFVMGLLDFRPVELILLAQAINGILLPVVVLALFVVGFQRGQTAQWYLLVVWITILIVTFLGLHALLTATVKAGILNFNTNMQVITAGILAVISGILALYLRSRNLMIPQEEIRTSKDQPGIRRP